jgi:hypothetical protein
MHDAGDWIDPIERACRHGVDLCTELRATSDPVKAQGLIDDLAELSKQIDGRLPDLRAQFSGGSG